jgi:predicted acetyltransferase
MAIDILAADEAGKSELRAMLSAYLHELSRYGDVDLGYRYFDSYWSDDDRWPYIIKNDERTAGFALINTWSPSGRGTDFSVAEFYILPRFRGTGAGKRAFARLLCSRPGIWELGVMSDNQAGKAFWESALATAGVSEIERVDLDGKRVHRFFYKP